MRLGIIALLVCGTVGSIAAQEQPVEVSLEWVELDCSKCPELVERLQPKQGQMSIVDRTDAIFIALEKKAAKRTLVHHIQYMTPGSRTKQTTRIGETSFALELAIPAERNGVYDTAVIVNQSIGTPVPRDLKPGMKLTKAQMRGVKKSSMAFRVGLAPGHRVALVGVGQTGPKITAMFMDLQHPVLAGRTLPPGSVQ